MGFILRNLNAGPLAIDDLGITLSLGEDYDLTQENPKDVAESAQVGNDLYNALNTSAAVILDPLDDTTPLSTSASIAAAQAANNTHYRIKGGELDQLDDVNAASPSIGDGLVYGGSTWDPQPVATDIDRQQVYFVGKHGNDTNSGLTPSKAKLTFGSAITAASGQTPSITNKFSISCVDAGIYAESFTVPSFVSIEAKDAKIEGTIQVQDNAEVTVNEVEAAINNSAIVKVAGTSTSRVNAEVLRATGTGDTVTDQAGETGCLQIFARQVFVQNGAAIFDQSTAATGHIHVTLEDLYITGTGTGLDRGSGSGLIVGRVAHILDIGAGSGTAIDVDSGSVDVHIGYIDTTNAYSVAGPGTLRVFVNDIATGANRIQTSGAASVDVLESNVLRWETVTGTFTPRRVGFVAVDTSGAVATMNLPTPPSDGDNISFRDALNTFETNNLTVDAGAGNLIDDGGAGTQTVVLDVNGTSGIFIYSTAIGKWTFTRIQEEIAFSPSNVLYVTKNGDDVIGDGSFSNPFLTVKKGAQEAQLIASASNPTTVKVLDGVYDEVNPILLTSATSRWVTIQGSQEQSTIVRPTVNGQALFDMTSANAFDGPALSRLTLQGQNNGGTDYKTVLGGDLVRTSGDGIFFTDKVIYRDGNRGVNSGNGVITTEHEVILSFASVIGNVVAIDAKDGAVSKVVAQAVFFNDNDTTVLTSGTARVELGNFEIAGTGTSIGIDANDTSEVFMNSGYVRDHGTAIEANNESIITGTSVFFENNTIEFNQTLATARVQIQGFLSKTKQLITDGTNVSLNYIDTDSGDFIVGNADATGDPGKEFRVRDFDGRIAIGDNATNENIASGGVGGSRSVNLIDENGNIRIWRFTSVDGQDPALEYIKGINPANTDGLGDAPFASSVAGTPGTITVDVSGADYDPPLPGGTNSIGRDDLAGRAFPPGREFRVNGNAIAGDYTVVSSAYNSGTEEIDITVATVATTLGAGGTIVFGGGAGRPDGVSTYVGDPGAAVAAGTGNVWWDWFMQEDDYFVVRRRTGGGGTIDDEKLRFYTDHMEVIGATLYDNSDYELIVNFQAVPSAVNYWDITNAATGGDPDIAVIGADTDITMSLTPKGTGTVQVPTGYEANISADEDLINKAYFDANAGGIFGNEFYSAKDDTLSSTTSTTYVNKLTLTTPVLAGGDYKIEWYAETRPDDGTGGSRADTQVLLDGTTTIAEDENMIDDVVFGTDVGSWKNVSGFDIQTLTAAVHTIDIEFKVTTPGGANIRRARISITRVS